MKILVTGNQGFLGSHTEKFLLDHGHTVVGVDLDHDIRKGFPSGDFDVVFHFAAFVGGRKGIDHNPWKILENIELDRITFRWAESHCGKIVYPSSSAAYPAALQMQQVRAMKEDDIDLGRPFDVYGLSKVTAEQMLQHCKTLSHVIRPFSIYGPGQDLDYPIPNIIKQARQGKSVVWGSGKQTRDWVYIDDALRVFDYLLSSDEPLVLNIGSGVPVDFIRIAEIIYQEIHGFTVPVQTQLAEPEGVKHRYADTSKQASLGLGTRISIEEGIRKIVHG
jgi:nucleoside-diphosphate-sugar epimerase